MPSVAQAVAGTWRGGFIASEDEALTRRLRLAGGTIVPADAGTLDRCVASGRPVYALGATVQRVEHLGYRIVERPFRAPLAAVLRDLRPDQLVALALSPSALSWVGPAGMATLARLSLVRSDVLVQSSGRDSSRGPTAVARCAQVARASTCPCPPARSSAVVRLFAAVSVSARQGDASVDSPPDRLATGQHAALAVFDRAH